MLKTPRHPSSTPRRQGFDAAASSKLLPRICLCFVQALRAPSKGGADFGARRRGTRGGRCACSPIKFSSESESSHAWSCSPTPRSWPCWPPRRSGPGPAMRVHFTPGSRAAPTDPGAETRNCSNVKAGANFRSGAALPPRVCIGRRETVHGCTRQYLVGVLHAAITNDNLDPTGYASAAALTYQALHAHPSHSTIWLAGMTCACGVSVPSHWHGPAAGSRGAAARRLQWRL